MVWISEHRPRMTAAATMQVNGAAFIRYDYVWRRVVDNIGLFALLIMYEHKQGFIRADYYHHSRSGGIARLCHAKTRR